jgi:hypothetical protein
LIARGVIPSANYLCVFCNAAAESCNHMFLGCPFAHGVWMSIYRWLGFEGVFAETVQEHFMQHGGWIKWKKWNKVRYLVWIATVRFPWVARKKIVLKENLLVFLMLFLMLSYSHVVAFEDWIKQGLVGRQCSYTIIFFLAHKSYYLFIAVNRITTLYFRCGK